jgi:hypothetical protein
MDSRRHYENALIWKGRAVAAETRQEAAEAKVARVEALAAPLRDEVERLGRLQDSRQRVFEKAMRLARSWQARALTAESALRTADSEHELMPYSPNDPNDDRVMCFCGEGPIWDGNDPASEAEFAAHAALADAPAEQRAEGGA